MDRMRNYAHRGKQPGGGTKAGVEMNGMDDVAERVRVARKARKWTQRELAEAAGVSLGTVSNFERRKADPQATHLRAILRALELEDAGGDAQASETRREWPQDVKVFLDVMGIFLMGLPDDQREAAIYDITRQIVTRR